MHKLFENSYQYNMADNPTGATYRGISGYNDKWQDISFEAKERRENYRNLTLETIKSVVRENLSTEDKLNYDLFEKDIISDIENDKFPGEYLVISQMGGIHQSAANVFAMTPLRNLNDYENMLSRLQSYSIQIEGTIQYLKQGIKNKITPPKITLRNVPQQVLSQIIDDPKEAPILEKFMSYPDEIILEDQNRIRSEAIKIYTDEIIPALQEFHRFLTEDYLPNCRESIAWGDLPEGKEWYEFRVKEYTTTDLTPDEIFEIGHSEVKRIRGLMDQIIDSTGFKGNFVEFCEFLRTDSQFYFTEEDDLVRQYRDIAKRADAELVKLFKNLPSLPYGVIKIPDYAAKSQTTAYYQPGSLDAGRPGYYYVNTYDLSSRPKWEMEALSLHEAVPGHHLQISIAQELEGIPEFRKNGWYTAYGEGWALYTESLGDVMGFYTDPYSRFGQLTYEMWRAIRLVVDVGMHYKGWTRQQAIDFFIANSSKSLHDIEVEIDRYIVWPGQALAYKIGELKIQELRKFAEEELGDKFDIRDFHDVILRSGSIPLDILEKNIREWVAQVKI